MPYKFGEYEMVRIKNRGSLPVGAVRGWDETGAVYDLRLPDKQMLQIPEEDLETTGQFETPFRFYEVVEIHPRRIEDEPMLSALDGERGVVTGISSSTQSGYWGFAVEVQNGKCWYLEENELKSIGIILSEEQLYGPNEDAVTVRLSFNPDTGEETVISGDASLLNQGPIPLRVELNAL